MSDPSTVLREMNQSIQNLQEQMIQLLQTMQKMSANFNLLSDNLNQLVLVADHEQVQIGCVEPWYEPCANDPSVCVHKNLSPNFKLEVCNEFADREGNKPNQIITHPERVKATSGRIMTEFNNFPVGHIAGNVTTIPGADLTAKIPN